jgi:hypothetical protein
VLLRFLAVPTDVPFVSWLCEMQDTSLFFILKERDEPCQEKRFTEEQIAFALRRHVSGAQIAEIISKLRRRVDVLLMEEQVACLGVDGNWMMRTRNSRPDDGLASRKEDAVTSFLLMADMNSSIRKIYWILESRLSASRWAAQKQPAIAVDGKCA